VSTNTFILINFLQYKFSMPGQELT
jgi:hypothetical protein